MVFSAQIMWYKYTAPVGWACQEKPFRYVPFRVRLGPHSPCRAGSWAHSPGCLTHHLGLPGPGAGSLGAGALPQGHCAMPLMPPPQIPSWPFSSAEPAA